MSKNIPFRAPAFAIKLGELNKETGVPEIPKRIQILRVGTFKHDKYGKLPITKEVLLSIKKNFEDNVRGIDIALDYKHDNEAEAAAWFKALELSEDMQELFGVVDWTPKGKQKVEEKEYRYISPEFVFDYISNENKKSYGPTLLGAGLTNRPFIKEMDPIVQLQESTGGSSMDEKDQIIAQLRKELEDLKAQLNSMGVELTDSKKKLGEYAEKEKAAVEEKKLAEKGKAFDLMLSEGKVCEAQRESYLKDDMKTFVEKAQPLKLSEFGHSKIGDDKTKKDKSAEDQIIELAEKKIADKKATEVGEAISLVLSENPELAKQYNEKFKQA